MNKFENGSGISLVLEECDSMIWYIWRNAPAFWNREIQFWISKPQFTPRISFFFASAPNLVCYTWPVVCVFTKRSLGMNLSSSYQFPHGSVIKFCQFPCSAVFVVGEMTCTLGGKDETVLYIIRCFTLQTATGNEIWTKTRLGTVIWYHHLTSPSSFLVPSFTMSIVWERKISL